METSEEEGSAADSAPTASAAGSSEVNGGGGTASTNGRAAYGEIASKAVGMTESIKHAIVLLQIAKVGLEGSPSIQSFHFTCDND